MSFPSAIRPGHLVGAILAGMLGLSGVVGAAWLVAQAVPGSSEVVGVRPGAVSEPTATPLPPPVAPPAPQPLSEGSRYLLIGGGASPYHTQVSLEEHIARFQGLLRARGADAGRLLTYFAAGQSQAPAVEVLDATSGAEPVESEVAWVLGLAQNSGVNWRKTQLTELAGASTPEEFRKALVGSGSARRTLLYFAGHGRQDPSSLAVSLDLWGDASLTPAQLAGWLEQLPPDHRFIGIFAQCHAGGFADMLYPGGDLQQAPSARDRCGFFAAPPDFVAAGCTPEANRETPDDYSTWFLSALQGEMPGGKPLPSSPDLDRNGKVTFSEAHGFARIHDGTLDIPVSSVEQFLRIEISRLELFDGLTLASPFQVLLQRAEPAERVVLRSLAQALGLAQDPAAGLKARYEADRLSAELGRLDRLLEPLSVEADEARLSLKKRLLQRYPWLGNPLKPTSRHLLGEHTDAILKLLRTSPERQRHDRARMEARPIEKRLDVLELRQARWERLARAAETVVMEATLNARASKALKARFEALKRCEQDTL